MKYASICSQCNVSNSTVVFLFYRILSHNKIRGLRNGSFFGLNSLEKLWVAFCLPLIHDYFPSGDATISCFVYMKFILCIPVWAVILACLRAFAEKYRQDISEIWAALCASIQSWAPVQQGGWYTQTDYQRVMLKSSHNYTSVFHYQVSPTPQDKIREIPGRRCALAASPAAHR